MLSQKVLLMSVDMWSPIRNVPSSSWSSYYLRKIFWSYYRNLRTAIDSEKTRTRNVESTTDEEDCQKPPQNGSLSCLHLTVFFGHFKQA
ncbi:hypothetical protein AVEN_62486-1 [Araneus ventricosus]|uniref:Uncharacterized protein n=1 Tax=Araneus ventricosus TaxID=182803 RepID=A0A4Y2LBM6_ARAVE|nr:hypothetical protein AVEN_62486-1 [Araneus ventricosus]